MQMLTIIGWLNRPISSSVWHHLCDTNKTIECGRTAYGVDNGYETYIQYTSNQNLKKKKHKQHLMNR